MSKFIDKLSVPSTKTELDLYSVPPTQVVIRRSFWEEVQLMNPITHEGPFEFRIPPDMYMLHLSKNYIYMRLRIVRPNGNVLQVAQPAQAPAAAVVAGLIAVCNPPRSAPQRRPGHRGSSPRLSPAWK